MHLKKEALQERARMYQLIRAFFLDKDVLEVETPIFSQAGNTDPGIQSLAVDFRSSGSREPVLRYAHTSPEFSMKRLLANGAGSIYQICKVFRLGEMGRLHNPEFSMLEWYRPGLNYHQLMDEIESLLRALGIAQNCLRISYSALFKQYLSLNIMTATSQELQSCAIQHGLDVVGVEDDYNDWCNVLLTHLIEPKLKKLGAAFIYDYPISQAALANIRIDEKEKIAERFELYIGGIEIANGYEELCNGQEYRQRFLLENKQREIAGLDEVLLDENLLSALESGLPKSSGVAVGLDRLLMCLMNKNHVKDVLSFDFQQA